MQQMPLDSQQLVLVRHIRAIHTFHYCSFSLIQSFLLSLKTMPVEA